jgi:hypothetical protein
MRKPVNQGDTENTEKGKFKANFPALLWCTACAAAVGPRFSSRLSVLLSVSVVNLLYTTSNSPAAPIPPPMHMVTTTYFTPRRLPSISAWPTRRLPVIP